MVIYNKYVEPAKSRSDAGKVMVLVDVVLRFTYLCVIAKVLRLLESCIFEALEIVNTSSKKGYILLHFLHKTYSLRFVYLFNVFITSTTSSIIFLFLF